MIEFDASSRVFSIYPVATSHEVWVCGTRFVKTGIETVTIDASSGLNYIYYDTSGTLGAQKTFFIWDQQAPTAYIYYNADHPEESMLFDERHGITMDWATHEYLHRTRGAAIANGFSIGNYTLTGSGTLDSDAQFSLTNGTFFDEDLQVDITDTSGTIWSQDISPIAYVPVLYLNTTSWRKDTAISVPIKNAPSGGRPYYNTVTGGTGTLTEADNNKFVVYWIVATNMNSTPIVSIMGQHQYTNIAEANATSWNSMVLTGLPLVEKRPLYLLAFETDGYTNICRARLRGVTDLRTLVTLVNSDITYKTFVIEHPIDISRYLVHACLEGPEAGVYYRGDAVIAEGDTQVTITLPSYVAVIATDFTVQLTPIDEPRLLAASRVVNGRFTVRGPPGSFYWQVTGRRETLEAEPLKAIVNVQGDGPYRWINNA